ncbi:hypothetical protein Dsin_021189 [Dipteronia sinensis]|uniref:ADP/ATP translocase n=1 Tax=Dipteronia sinensis TaxID=43782 RepID=A0AAE0ABT4_9ROSI|nr:hypothetical protein Dsin_021189 [Dipteronia sinensis]
MVIAPTKRVIFLTQCQNEMIKSGRLSHPYKGIGDCFARTIRNEGIRSLLRGNTAYLLERIFSRNNPEACPMAKYALNIICTKLPTYPMDTVRRRMMMRSGEAVKYKNCLNAFSQILKNEGVKSLYKVAGADVLRMPLYIGVTLLLIDLSLMSWTHEGGQPASSFTIKWKNGGNDSNNSH